MAIRPAHTDEIYARSGRESARFLAEDNQVVKMNRQTLVEAALIFAVGIGLGNPGNATESAVTGMPSNELTRWEKSLQKAGATPAEVADFEEMLQDVSAADLPETEKYLNSTPTVLGEYLLWARRQAEDERRELNPEPLFPDIHPIRSCKSLREISLPDSTVDIATIDPKDGSCRITATVIHPPAHNPITVFIALPTKAWNSRFRGTGGGGYSGGSKGRLNAPVRKGYAVGGS